MNENATANEDTIEDVCKYVNASSDEAESTTSDLEIGDDIPSFSKKSSKFLIDWNRRKKVQSRKHRNSEHLRNENL